MKTDRREQVRRILAERDNADYASLETHDYQWEADRLLALWASADEENYLQKQRADDLERRMKEASEGVQNMVRLFEEYKVSANAEITELKEKLAALGERSDGD